MKKTVSLALVLAMIAVIWTGFGSAASASEAQAMNNTEKAKKLNPINSANVRKSWLNIFWICQKTTN